MIEAVDKYIQAIPGGGKDLYKATLDEIIKNAPDSTIYMSYGMPCFKYKGKYLIGVGAFKDHLSLFPGGEVTKKFKVELKEFKTSKGTIQFTTENTIPLDLIRKIIKFRIGQIDS